MEDPALEAGIVRVKELITIWQKYYSLLLAAFDKEKELPADADEQFQKIKTVVAQRHDQFSTVIKKDHYVAQNILQMVKRTISIYDFEKASPVAVDKTLIEWHDANLLLYETLGSLEWDKHKLSKVSEAEHKAQERRNKRIEQWNKFRSHREIFAALKIILIASVVLGVWFSPIKTWVIEIPFVHTRINEFREVFGMKPLPDKNEEVQTENGQ